MGIFDDIKQFQSWKRSKDFLLKAKSFVLFNLLDEIQMQTIKDFDEFIKHNELGLAFEQLIFLSETINLPIEFWKEMFLAAKEMKLEDEAKKCKLYLK